MRRALAVLTVAGLGVALFAGTRPVDDAHAATSCTKHTKRVVKHLKRHGKRKRVVHFKHWWTCQAVAEPAPSAPAPTTTAPTEPPPTPTAMPEPEPNAVSVTAYEKPAFGFGASRQTVKAGHLTVQLIDAGEDEHNMEMQRVGPGEVPEGPVVTMLSAAPTKPSEAVSVEVQPGTYRMWCTLPHHDEKGMHTTITVVE